MLLLYGYSPCAPQVTVLCLFLELDVEGDPLTIGPRGIRWTCLVISTASGGGIFVKLNSVAGVALGASHVSRKRHAIDPILVIRPHRSMHPSVPIVGVTTHKYAA